MGRKVSDRFTVPLTVDQRRYRFLNVPTTRRLHLHPALPVADYQ
jgi:hypothetical protein